MFDQKRTKNIKTASIVVCVWLLLSGSLLVWGKLIAPGDEMAYSLLAFYLIYPISALICSTFLSAKNNIFGYLIVLLYAGGGVLLPALLYSGVDAISLFYGAIPAFVGLLIGACIHVLKKRIAEK